jgi:hypothetical protein
MLFAQLTPPADTTIIFTPGRPEKFSVSEVRPLRNSLGLDIMLSNNGFGLGLFFRKEYTDEFAGSLSLAISDVKGEGEIEYYDYWTGRQYIPNKKNRLLMLPLIASLQYRLFKEDIADNFRPYVSAGFGPSMIFAAPYARRINQIYMEEVDFFESLKYGQAHYTLGGFIGAGAYFGLDRGSLSGLSFRYYFIPFQKGIEVMEGGMMKNFGGFYITLNFGNLY